MRTVQTGYEVEAVQPNTRQASAEGVQAFVQASFGLSAHWGLYSLIPGDNEWVYYNRRITLENYRRLMDRFNPTRFNADEWADLMLEAGMKFLLITTKHHDGFCMWDSDLTDFKVTNTRFGRDVIAELSQALHARGLSLHFYYSLLDWTRPSYRQDWPAYLAYYHGQLLELCSNYGEIGGFLFDGYWPRAVFEGDEPEIFAPRGGWDLAGAYNLIHELQPNAVVTNNTHVMPLPGEDYQVWELDLPGENKIGFNTTEVGAKALASWWNLNEGWSYQPWRHHVKSANEILPALGATILRKAVFMLNVGPRPFGDIHPDEQQVLRQIGQVILQRK